MKLRKILVSSGPRTRKILGVLLLLLLMTFLTATFAFAVGNGELPPGKDFMPDSSSFEAAKVPLSVLIFIAGIIASVYFGVGIIKVLVKDVKDIFHGNASLADKQGRFTAVGVCFIILLLVITGKWYDIISIAWNKIFLPMLNKINS